MKRLIIALVVLGLMATGCVPAQKEEPENSREQIDVEIDIPKEEDATPAIQDEKAVMEAFNTLVEDSVVPKELDAFLNKHISNLGIESANKALVSYLDAVLQFAGREDTGVFEKNYQAYLSKLEDNEITRETIAGLENEPLSEEANWLYDNGLCIEPVGDRFVVAIDFETLLKKYGNEIGEDIKSYIELEAQMLKSRQDYRSLDGLNHIAQLIVEHDRYLKDFPNSMVRNQIYAHRNWLRDLYFVLSAEGGGPLGGSGEIPVFESFADVVEFYPGSVLEGMTQRYLEMWGTDKTVPDQLRTAYVAFYDLAFKDTAITLDQGVTLKGRVYPKLGNVASADLLNQKMQSEADGLFEAYSAPDMIDWEILQSYDVAYLDQTRISVVFVIDLINPKYPRLSMRDMKASTYDLETGDRLLLVDILPTEEESEVHLLADVKAFADSQGYGLGALDNTFENAYQVEDGIVVYTPNNHLGDSVSKLFIPSEQIEDWIDE